MYLKRLQLHGFKSFAHKTILDFDPGLTAVVGPNGSGKSNIADAIRWVTGEQSLKLLRGKKSEDVIFAGSDKKTRLSVAEAALTFDNKDHKLPFEYSEVVIARRIYRDGESEYLINNQKARLLDVVDALLRSGFGATNYAVIGQGTIDQMVMAGPAEIKVLVEEAAGVKPYYLKREKTIRRLDQTQENLVQVSQLVAEIEPRLRSLKRQAKRMEEREIVASQLASAQLEYFGHEFCLFEDDLGKISLSFSSKQSEVAQLEKEIGDFQKTLELEESSNKTPLAYSYELSNKIDGLEAKRYKLQEELAEIRGKIKSEMVPGQIDSESLNAQKLDLQRHVDALSGKLKSLSENYKKDQSGFNKLKEQVANLSGKLNPNAVAIVLNSFEKEFNQALDQLSSENVQSIKAKLKNLLTTLLNFGKNLGDGSNLPQATNVKEGLQKELHGLELKMMEGKTLIAAYTEQLSSDTAKLNQIKSLFAKNPQEFKNELFKQENELNFSLSNLLKQIDELKDSLAKVKLEEKNKRTFLSEEEKKFRSKAMKLSSFKDEQNKVLIEKTRLETRLESLQKEAREALGEKYAQLSNFKKPQIQPDVADKIIKLKKQLELAGGFDEATLNEYKETQERFDYLTKQSNDLSKAVEDLKQAMQELDEVIKKQFNEAFDKISESFSEYFRILFNGGRASMSLLREEVVRTEAQQELIAQAESEEIAKKTSKAIMGIEIKANPPGKKLSSIAALSGGERALTAIALLCSMLASYPSPFVVLDEVDAALDEANSIRFAKILGTLAHQTQFITITHNRETMREAHTLYGVTMNDDGISKILSLKLEQISDKILNDK